MSGHTRRTFVRAVLWLSPLALFLVGVGSAIDEFPSLNADPTVAAPRSDYSDAGVAWKKSGDHVPYSFEEALSTTPDVEYSNAPAGPALVEGGWSDVGSAWKREETA
ncbi:MAG: hypothetical protein ACYC1C_00820 [Chloroflexota bacterium]